MGDGHARSAALKGDISICRMDSGRKDDGSYVYRSALLCLGLSF